MKGMWKYILYEVKECGYSLGKGRGNLVNLYFVHVLGVDLDNLEQERPFKRKYEVKLKDRINW